MEQTRQIISARQWQKLAKNGLRIFLAIVRPNDSPNKRDEKTGKRSHNREAKFSAAHGLAEGQKRLMNKSTSSDKIYNFC